MTLLFVFARKIVLYIILLAFMAGGLGGASLALPIIVSYLKHWSAILLVEICGLLFLFTGLKLVQYANRVWSQTVSIWSKDGILALACVFLIGFGGAWTAMSTVNILGWLFYLVAQSS